MMSEQETLYTMACDCASLRYDGDCACNFGDASCISCRLYIGNYSQANMNGLKLFMYGAENEVDLLKYKLEYNSPSSVALRDAWRWLKNLVKTAIMIGVIGLAGYYGLKLLVYYAYRGVR